MSNLTTLNAIAKKYFKRLATNDELLVIYTTDSDGVEPTYGLIYPYVDYDLKVVLAYELDEQHCFGLYPPKADFGVVEFRSMTEYWKVVEQYGLRKSSTDPVAKTAIELIKKKYGFSSDGGAGSYLKHKIEQYLKLNGVAK